MTVTANSRRREYQGNGVTQVFNGPMAYARAHVYAFLVKANIMTLVPQENFDVEKLGAESGTRVTMHTPPAADEMLLLLRTMPYTQETDITNQGAFHAETIEKGFDALEMQIQQLADGISRSIKLPDTSTGVTELPALVPLAPIVVNSTGTGFDFGSTLGTGDMLLRPNLADSLDPAKGAALVAFRQAGANAVARTALDKLREAPVTPEDFGAVGDGVADDYLPISRACAAAATTLHRVVQFTKETYAISATLNVPQGVRLVGRGNASAAFNGYLANEGSTIKWIGATGGGSIAVRFRWHNFGGGGMDRMRVDADAKADVAVDVDGCIGLRFDTCTFINSLGIADLRLDSTLSPHGNTATTCSWNTFVNIRLAALGSGANLLIDGDYAAGNACHNSFVNLKIDHGGSKHGIALANCDNNKFDMVYIWRESSGTGYGVEVQPDGAFPIGNVFNHLQAGLGGWHQPSNTAEAPAQVWDYMLDNGQPYPVLNGTKLWYSTNFGFMPSELPRAVGDAGNPAFNGAWVNYGSGTQAAQFFKDRLGIVHLRGMVKSGAVPGTIFTLPNGYRPTADEYFGVDSNSAHGLVYITAAGAVVAQAGNATWFSLSGITFRADYPQS